MQTDSVKSTTEPLGGRKHTRWSLLLVGHMAALIMVNAMADTVIKAPLQVLPELLDYFRTDQLALLNASAMLAGAMWAPLLGKCADIYGKRRMLVMTLLVGCVGALVCLMAPNMWVFVLGRALQGAALASVFLTVAIIRDLCAPRIAMPVVGIVTTGASIFGIGAPFLYETLTAQFGFRVVFVASAVLAITAAICVRGLIPKSTIRTAGRIDVAGAVLLGGGLVAVLSYISFGPEFGWFAIGPLALLGGGAAALVRWFLVSSRKAEPVVDIRNLSRPLMLTLLVIVLGAGTTEMMDQLNSVLVDVSPDQQLGYGVAAPAAEGLMFGIAGIGGLIGGPLAGVLATRIGPAATLAGSVAIGVVGTVGMFFGVSQLYVAVFFTFLLSLTVGSLVTAGYNMAGTLAPAEQQSSVSSLVMLMTASGAVFLNFVGSTVLASTNTVVDGSTVNSATGVFSNIAIGVGTFVIAAMLAVRLVRRQRSTRMTPSPAVSEPVTSSSSTPG